MKKKLTTTARVALMMLSVLMEIFENHGWDLDNKVEDAIDFLMENIYTDRPISFPWGVNYETFIVRQSKYGDIEVYTCNNHNW